MLKRIEEFGKYVIVTGFKRAKIDDVKRFLEKRKKKQFEKVEIQFFDARYVASWQHLYFAALNALVAFRNGQNISKSLSMETMLYGSAQRQIRKAMELLGITKETEEIAVLIIGERVEEVKLALFAISECFGVQNNDGVLELSEEKVRLIKEAFGISEQESNTVVRGDYYEEALVNLVIERMAISSTER